MWFCGVHKCSRWKKTLPPGTAMWTCRSQGCEPFRSLGSWEGWGDVGSGLSLLHSQFVIHVHGSWLLSGVSKSCLWFRVWPLLSQATTTNQNDSNKSSQLSWRFQRKSLTLFAVKGKRRLGQQLAIRSPHTALCSWKSRSRQEVCTSTSSTMPHGRWFGWLPRLPHHKRKHSGSHVIWMASIMRSAMNEWSQVQSMETSWKETDLE